MLRIILWSSQAHLLQEGKTLAKILAQETNILPLVLSEESTLEEIAKLQQRESLTDTTTLFVKLDSVSNQSAVLQIVSTAQGYKGDYATFSLSNGSEIWTTPELTADTLVHAISENQLWTLDVTIVRDEFIQQVTEAHSVTAALLKMAFRAMSEHSQVDWNLENVALTSHVQNSEALLSGSQCADLLRYALAVINIEDLFPQHSWEEYPEESAAACYHSLAAKFIALGELPTARECLLQSDQLEDSPRSLALKGIIAMHEGEVLSAVANMVSSLQEYERRKGGESSHYLSFTPNNLEVINSRLQSGLSALNEQKNDKAAEFFTDAVFEFDGFYRECGLELSKYSS
ncbi:MAG: hypothetical protein ACO3XO_06330 [Bdellovibrionota bacterium]|jgi:hypothetical protein